VHDELPVMAKEVELDKKNKSNRRCRQNRNKGRVRGQVRLKKERSLLSLLLRLKLLLNNPHEQEELEAEPVVDQLARKVKKKKLNHHRLQFPTRQLTSFGVCTFMVKVDLLRLLL
jgi:hypothetical protein